MDRQWEIMLYESTTGDKPVEKDAKNAKKRDSHCAKSASRIPKKTIELPIAT